MSPEIISTLKQVLACIQRNEILLNEVNAKLDRLESPNAIPEWIDKHKAAAIVGNKHWKTLDKWRMDPSKGLRENIHWLNDGGEIVYHAELLKDWYRNRNDPETHLKVIENFTAKLPANQPKKRTRKVF